MENQQKQRVKQRDGAERDTEEQEGKQKGKTSTKNVLKVHFSSKKWSLRQNVDPNPDYFLSSVW